MTVNTITDSEMISTFETHKPEKLRDFFKPYGDQGASNYLLFRELGYEKSVALDKFSHYELDEYESKFKAASNVNDPGAGNALEVVIHADNVDSKNRFYPQRFDQVMLKNEVKGIIMSIDTAVPAAPELTILPLDTTQTFGAVVAEDEIIVYTRAASEASGQPISRLSGATQFYNEMQTIKDTFTITGHELTNQQWIQLNLPGNPWYWEGQAQSDYNLLKNIDGALTFGERNTNTSVIDPDTGNRLVTTEGCYTYAKRVANDFPVATGAMDMDDFDEIDLILENYNVGGYMLGIFGSKRYQNIENMLTEWLKTNADVTYTKEVAQKDLFGGRTGKDLTINFRWVTKSDRTWALKRNPLLNKDQLYGAKDFKLNDLGLMLPMGRQPEAKTGKPMPDIGIRYKAFAGYNRRHETWALGGAGPIRKNTQYDKMDIYQRAHVGAHNARGRRWVYIYAN